MTPIECNYTARSLLSEILKDHRLKDTKYSGPSSKYVKIAYGFGYYQADGHFLKSLLEKFGDVCFSEAVERWRGQCA